MAKQITTKKFTSNVILSIIAQIISLAVSFVMTLIVPKFIDTTQYSYWQKYVLYVNYVGVLHFGLLDGMVLRYSKYDYDELDKKLLRSQFVALLTFTGICTLLTSFITSIAFGDADRIIFIFVAVGIVTKNIVTYSSYLFQITNRISKYVILSIGQRVVYGLAVVLLLVCKCNNFYWFCAADILCDLVGIAIGLIFNRGLYFGKLMPIRQVAGEMKINIASGIILMLANWSASLLVGSAKMITEWRWNELVFGKVAFAFSVSNVFLVFVTAISVVLFPSLKRIDSEKLPQMYKSIRSILSPLLFFMMLFYFVGVKILELWLPDYFASLTYLGILLPIIIYSSKVSLLTNNYLKVYRKEKYMLIANAISIALGFALFALCAYAFNNLIALLSCIVFVVMFNSVLSEIFVMRTIHVKIVKDFIIEAIMTVGFILCASLLDLWVGFGVYCGLFAIYCAINYKSLVELFKSIGKIGKHVSANKNAVAENVTATADENIPIEGNAAADESDESQTAIKHDETETDGSGEVENIDGSETPNNEIQGETENL